MKMHLWEKWLCEFQWDGHPLKDILADTTPIIPRLESSVDQMNYIAALRSLFILTNGRTGEKGEKVEHFKKWIRDGKINKYAAGLEIGDELAYLTWLAHVLGYTLEDIAQLNYAKLTARGKKESAVPGSKVAGADYDPSTVHGL